MEYNKEKQCRCYFAILRLLLDAKKPMKINEITEALSESDFNSEIVGDFTMDKKTVATSIRALSKALDDVGFSCEGSPLYLSIEPKGFDENGENVKVRGGFSINQRPIDFEDVENIVNALNIYDGIGDEAANEIIKKLRGIIDPNYRNKIQDKSANPTPEEEEKSRRIKENLSKINWAEAEDKKIEITNGRWTFDEKGKVYLKPSHKYVLEAWEKISNNGNQYLVGKIKEGHFYPERNFRIDRIYKVRVLKDGKDSKAPGFDQEKIALIRKFGMYSGDPYPITIMFEPKLLNPIIDKFIDEENTVKKKGKLLTIDVRAPFTDQFFGWLAGLDGEAVLVGIGENEYREFLDKRLKFMKSRGDS